MKRYFYFLPVAVILLLASCDLMQQPELSHGPLLGAVSENSAAIWIRTTIPAEVLFTLSEVGKPSRKRTKNISTSAQTDNTCIARFHGLIPDTKYRYEISTGNIRYEHLFTTKDPSLKSRNIRIVYGYGYNPREDSMPAGMSIFSKMQLQHADAVLFLGDFPYTALGSREQIRNGNKELREVIGFKELTAGTPTYGIYDDHDFGPNDTDGLHKYADEALATFKEYWPNSSYGLENDKGIYSSFVIGDVEVFLLDGRYHSRQTEENPTMLGNIQFDWLCEGLSQSSSRYKVLVSGTPFSRIKDDCWAGRYFINERDSLFKYINDNNITGVIGISGDIHRCDIFKIPIGSDRHFYDFTAGSLSRIHRSPPEQRSTEMIYSYGFPERNMFAEIDFHPDSDSDTALVFRSFSGKTGLVYEHVLSPVDLNIK